MQYWEKNIRNWHTWKNHSKPGKLPVAQGNLTGINCATFVKEKKRKKMEISIEKKYGPQKQKKTYMILTSCL